MDKSTYAILDCITEGVAILDHRFVVIHWNKHLEALTNRTKADVVGKSIFEIFGKLDRAPYKHIFQTTMERGTQHFFSSKIHKQMIVENKHINFKISRVEIGRENGIIVEFTDSTNEHIRVQQLKENVNKLAQLNKELKIKEQEIEKLAYTDHLTGLSNRILFYSFAEKLMASTRRNGSLMGVMFIDVDKFKYISYSLIVILAFVGVKMLIVHHVDIPDWLSLGVIVLALAGGMLASKWAPKEETHH